MSWQYHHRRSEILRLIDSQAAVTRREDDVLGQLEVLKKGDTITLYQEERHRLVGLEDWGVVAEIW